MPWPNPNEVAVLTVNGTQYQDWETVWVKHTLRDIPHYSFRFTCSEGMPLARNMAAMRINTGMQCSIELGGFPAFNGRVSTRQVFYDAKRHHIEIMGQTNMELSNSTVVKKDMEWPKNTSIMKIIQDVLSPLGITPKVEGGSISTQTDQILRASHGTTVHDFLDEITRHIPGGAGIGFTSNPQGDFVIALGPIGGGDSVVEGQNILEGRELIYSPAIASDGYTLSQPAPDDKTNGPKASQLMSSLPLGAAGNIKALATSFMELATTKMQHLQARMSNERNWLQEDQVTVWATVQGWLKPSGGLWERNSMVSVTSPMLIMNGDSLRMRSVIFSQDDRTGTRSILELQNPAAFGGGVEPLA